MQRDVGRGLAALARRRDVLDARGGPFAEHVEAARRVDAHDHALLFVRAGGVTPAQRHRLRRFAAHATDGGDRLAHGDGARRARIDALDLGPERDRHVGDGGLEGAAEQRDRRPRRVARVGDLEERAGAAHEAREPRAVHDRTDADCAEARRAVRGDARGRARIASTVPSPTVGQPSPT